VVLELTRLKLMLSQESPAGVVTDCPSAKPLPEDASDPDVFWVMTVCAKPVAVIARVEHMTNQVPFKVIDFFFMIIINILK